jgi:hypothetical protein
MCDMAEFLPIYEPPPPWIAPHLRQGNPAYDNDIRKYLPRKVCLRRQQMNDMLGFNVRGGEDFKCGLFISWVKPDSEADRLGLREGDEILEANGVGFDGLNHDQAVAVLKRSLDVYLIVKYFPYGYKQSHKFDPPPPAHATGPRPY